MRPRIYRMSFGTIYDAWVNKARRKNHAEEEVLCLLSRVTGYTPKEIQQLTKNKEMVLEDFFMNAPQPHPKRFEVRGTICGVRVEEVAEPVMREIRIVDLLLERLVRGKTVDNLLAPQ